MWEDRERRAQRLRVSVIVLAVSVLFLEWWSSDLRTVSFATGIDRLFHDTPQSRPASTPTGASALPPSTRRSDQPTSVGTGGSGGGGFTSNPNSRVDPIAHGDPPVVAESSRRDVKPEEHTVPKDARKTSSQPAPCDPRQAAAREATDAQTDPQQLSKNAVPCEDPSRGNARNTSTPAAQ